MNMTIAELKGLISDLPDNMPVIIPVIDEKDLAQALNIAINSVYGLTADQDIADQVYFSGKDASVEKVLFGQSKYDQGKEKDA